MSVTLENKMDNSNLIERTIFQALGIFSGIFPALGKVVWSEYQSFAIPRIEEGTFKLKQALPHISTLTPEIAAKDLAFIKTISEGINTYQQQIESIEDKDFDRFRQASLNFFKVLLVLKAELNKAAGQGDNTRASFHYMTRNRKNPAFSKYLGNAGST